MTCHCDVHTCKNGTITRLSEERPWMLEGHREPVKFCPWCGQNLPRQAEKTIPGRVYRHRTSGRYYIALVNGTLVCTSNSDPRPRVDICFNRYTSDDFELMPEKGK